MQYKTAFFWSSGKDSALALHYLLNDPAYKIEHLITTINKDLNRVTMHGTPIELLKKQLDSIGLPYSFMKLSTSATIDEYEAMMQSSMHMISNKGIAHTAFGDIFLEDLRDYRINQMNRLGFQPLFPIWKRDTKELIHEFINHGFKAVIVCVNEVMGPDFLGREIDHSFLKDLPKDIDPCGENGEFHTFCYDGPIFGKPIDFRLGEKVKRSYPNPEGDGEVDFWFIDLITI
ncbi:diphthine--ammonia ligase [Ekhidna sp.]|uniref:Dph6-related ATP pyrophosphatase n=1 Tax=Ekhidna sp. TaxID=2608089 RepID=UPI0032EE87E8